MLVRNFGKPSHRGFARSFPPTSRLTDTGATEARVVMIVPLADEWRAPAADSSNLQLRQRIAGRLGEPAVDCCEHGLAAVIADKAVAFACAEHIGDKLVMRDDAVMSPAAGATN